MTAARAPDAKAVQAAAVAAPLSEPVEQAFEDERLRVLVQYSAGLRWQMATIALVIAALLWSGGHALATTLCWLAVTLGVREWRAACLVKLLYDPRPMAVRRRAVTILTLALGFAYGSSALFMPGMDTAYDAIVTMILLSLGAGAITTTFTVLPAFVAFGVGIIVPPAAAWLATGWWPGGAVALLMLLFLGVQVRFARLTQAMYADSFGIRRANNELLRQLRDERGRLAQARDAAVAADLAKSRFLAAASHDLRQPLQSLALNSGALARQPLQGESRQIAGDMAQGIDALQRMLDTLLDLSQLDAGAQAPELRPLALDRVVEGVVRRFLPAAQAKGLKLTSRCPAHLTVLSDAQMLQRVLSNLLDNALKFTAAGEVTLYVEDLGDTVRLTVADTGCGIDPADQARVFEDLVQLDNAGRNSSLGHGLGLGIVRRLTRLLGIEIALRSSPGVGTQVHLLLRRSGELLSPSGEPAPQPPGLVARRILVLDDDLGVRQAYGHALGVMGCEVVSGAHLDEILPSLRTFQPEVALVDYRLGGGVDGLQAVREIRRRLPSLRAILITADATSALRSEAASLGVPVLRKPVSDAALALAINNVVSRNLGAEPSR